MLLHCCELWTTRPGLFQLHLGEGRREGERGRQTDKEKEGEREEGGVGKVGGERERALKTEALGKGQQGTEEEAWEGA